MGYRLSDCRFEYRGQHLNIRYHVCFERGVPWHSGNYRVYIKFKTRMRHDKNIQSPWYPCYIFEYVYLEKFHVNFLPHRHLSRGHRISYIAHHLGRTDNKSVIGLIGPKHMTTIRAVAHQSWMVRCYLRVL